jgi:succinate dehydrogenase/fumarate reductase cytochrome b subunit
MLVSDKPGSFGNFIHDETDHKSSSHIITAMSWAILFIPLTIYVSLFSDDDQHMQQTSFQILCGCLIVFFFFGNVTTIILIYLREFGGGQNIVMIALEQARYVPVVTLFFSGLLYHIFNGLFRHMFDLSAEWGATTKEMESVEYTLSLFCSEVWDTIKRFWFMYICIVLYSLSWALVYLFGPEWLNWNGIAMMPFLIMIVAHAVMPILLNPNAMYSLYYGLKTVLCCAPTKSSGMDQAKKELQGGDNLITFYPEKDLESANTFEFELGETEHTKKSSWSNYVYGGMDGKTEHTNKSSWSNYVIDPDGRLGK